MRSPDPFFDTVQRAREGDEQAMAELFDAFFPKVFQYVSKRVDIPENAEDIASDIFLEVVRELRSFAGKSTFATWIFGIAKNKIAGFWREKYALPVVPLENFLAREEHYTVEEENDDFEVAEKKWEHFHELVTAALEHLRETPRKLLQLRFLQNYTLAEAAEELNLNKNTVKVMQFRALKKLRELAEGGTISFSSPSS